MSQPAVRFYIVRHGETDENRQRIIQGQLDTDLNAAGLEQAQLTAKALENVLFSAAYTSDLSRAQKTAEIILAKQKNAPALNAYTDLRERHMGDLQGQVSARDRNDPANAEAVMNFQTRAMRLWNKLVQRHTQSRPEATTEHVLVTSHGGFIGVLIQGLIGSRKVRCGNNVTIGRCLNASITVIEVGSDGKGQLVSYADTTHLDTDLVQVNVDTVGSTAP